MKKILRWTAIIIGSLLMAIQFVQPDRTNPTVDEKQTIQALTKIPPEISLVLQRGCYDCHSNESKWPWYSYIAPSSWLVAYDVHKARQMMNFSEWGKYKGLRAVSKLDQICMNITQGEMPLPRYLIMHPAARLTKAEIDSICSWIEREEDQISSE